MSEYIKKEDTIEYLNDLFGEMYHVSFGNVLQSLDSLQTYSFPDSAENKGEWIYLDECANNGYYCSICHKRLVKDGWSDTVKKIKFCPNCGADMRGKVE